jgi:hypothetical protein
MKTRPPLRVVSLFLSGWLLGVVGDPASSGAAEADSPPALAVGWTISSAAKIRPDQPVPSGRQMPVAIRCARNEREAAQVVLRSREPVRQFRIRCSALTGPNNAVLAERQVEILQVKYLNITQPTDRSAKPGLWPDPLLPVSGPLDLQPDFTHAFWIRLFVPPQTPAGRYEGRLELTAEGLRTNVSVSLTVYDFALPDRMTCVTAFGFSPEHVFRYHRLQTEEQRRMVLEKYWVNLATHHISPYDPAPLDQLQVRWPDVRPPKTTWDRWSNLRIVSNEVHAGQSALLIYDDKTDENVTVAYEPMIKIPPKGLRVRCWYRTALPGHQFIVTLHHFDADKKWMSGRNNDMTLRGSGQWQNINELLTDFPPGAEYVQFLARATRWSDQGEEMGLVWFDDISISNPDTGEEYIQGGDFEVMPRTEPVTPREQLGVQFDFAAWDRAMTRAIDQHHFNSFRLGIPGLGGGSFHAISQPNLLGFGEDTPEYPILLDSYCRQLEAHLREKGWLDEAFIYWFDEPSPDQYPFVMNGFAKLKRSCPGIARMLTEQVEPALIGGPNVWCSISNNYDHERAEARRRHGEKFWWYVCTGPKVPYAGLFIDHAAPEMRLWLWQTFQRNIEGILVWATDYWTSSAAYPHSDQPQDPYEDPMSWTSGYSTPNGTRHPWGNGDGRFIYPPPAAAKANSKEPILDGPVDSVRWEHLRDGIEDYEYLCLLRQKLQQQQNSLPADLRAQYAALLQVPESITRSLTEFALDGEPIEVQRHKIAQAIEALR